jgi:hypothetical protein
MIIDIVVTSDDKFMWTAGEQTIFKWDINSRTQALKINKQEQSFMYLVLSSDDKKLMSNGIGPYITVVDTTQDEN